MAPRASSKGYLRLADTPERASPRKVATVDLMQALRGVAAPGHRDGKAKPKKAAGGRAATKSKPAPPQGKAD